MSYIDNSALSDTQSTNNLDELLVKLEGGDILDTAIRVKGSPWYDNRDARYLNNLIHETKVAINKAGSNTGYVWWEIFKVVYQSRLRMNAWTGELLLDGKPTSHEALLDRLENALGMLSKLTKEQFERKFQVFIGKGFNPVRDELQGIANRFTKIEEVTEEIDKSSWIYEDQDTPSGSTTTYETQVIQLLPEWDKLASILFGADDPLSQKMLEKWLIAAVARAMVPGCQADNSLVLMGKQGIGKSSFFRVLGGDYFLDLDNSTDGTETKRQLAKSWIVEMGEMEGITRKKEVEELKAFLTKTKDTFRGLYERRPTDHDRHVVFGGTCNSDEVLRDNTGSRRFWIIPCGDRDINIDFLKVNRDAILAHAFRLWSQGVTWWADKEMSELSEERNKAYQETNEFEHHVAYIVSRLDHCLQHENTINGRKNVNFTPYDGIGINASELMSVGLGIPVTQHKTNRNDRKVAQSLTQLGYIKTRKSVEGRQVWYWVKPGVNKPYLLNPQDLETSKR